MQRFKQIQQVYAVVIKSAQKADLTLMNCKSYIAQLLLYLLYLSKKK